MTYQLDFEFVPAPWQAQVDRYFAEQGQGMNCYLLRRRRLAALARLNAMTDSELALMGLRRDDISAFVFDDILPGTEPDA